MSVTRPRSSARALRLTADRTAGTHPYLVVPDHTRDARQLLGPGVTIAPEHKVVLTTDAAVARQIGREFLAQPYLNRRNYTNNLRRYGYTDDDIAHGGSNRLIDALVLHGALSDVAAGLRAHLDAGADHIALQVLGPDVEHPMPGYRRLAEALRRPGAVDARGPARHRASVSSHLSSPHDGPVSHQSPHGGMRTPTPDGLTCDNSPDSRSVMRTTDRSPRC